MNILIVDDFAYFRAKVRSGIKAKFSEIQVEEAGTLVEAQNAVKHTEFDMILLDLDLTGTANTKDSCNDGLELITYMTENNIKIPHIVVVSGKVWTPEAVVNVAKYGIRKVIQKPYKIGEIEKAIMDYMGTTENETN